MRTDELKFDQIFVSRITGSERDREIAMSITLRAQAGDRGTGRRGRGEAVFALLRDLDCGLVQGYHFNAPLSQSDFAAWWTALATDIAPEQGFSANSSKPNS